MKVRTEQTHCDLCKAPVQTYATFLGPEPGRDEPVHICTGCQNSAPISALRGALIAASERTALKGVTERTAS